MQNFQKEAMKMDMGQEYFFDYKFGIYFCYTKKRMMDDILDGGDEIEDEVDDVLGSVLDEIGLEVKGSVCFLFFLFIQSSHQLHKKHS